MSDVSALERSEARVFNLPMPCYELPLVSNCRMLRIVACYEFSLVMNCRPNTAKMWLFIFNWQIGTICCHLFFFQSYNMKIWSAKKTADDKEINF